MLRSKRIVINILYNILPIFTLISFKATVLLYILILLKILIAEVAKGEVINLDIAAGELVALIELIIAVNLI